MDLKEGKGREMRRVGATMYLQLANIYVMQPVLEGAYHSERRARLKEAGDRLLI